ncbi:hypothetical protein VTJ49DRAFT_1298 [Mycothermus thermophilus]|uniref:Uncharacterized protein n=1 Tax=Humicola insolens TaxID=85995 RepID=A0ABR3VCW4_HUMIN
MAPKRIGGGSRRSYNPVTNIYNALFVSENAPVVRSIAAFGVSLPRQARSRMRQFADSGQIAVTLLSTGVAEAWLVPQ